MARNKSKPAWWEGAVVYQIYPRSFCDSTGDGVGDLNGIRSKLDYIKGLGVDMIWISPFMKSPMKDFGYDISDYREVDPIFGTLEDFESLVEEAHRREIKIMIDMVLAHTSDQHQWFCDSKASRQNRKAGWYIWSDPKRDGTPPNNWLSVFGGPAWAWSEQRGQYYEHNFLPSQPTLNYNNSQVLKAMLEEMSVWLERGVSGFRLDAITCMSHDPNLRNNPPSRRAFDKNFSTPPPFDWQSHVFDRNRPEILGYLEEIRSLLDQYPETFSIGEVGDVADPIKVGGEYTAGNALLHTTYNFKLLDKRISVEKFKKIVTKTERHAGGSACYSFSNHDVKRSVSRWAQAIRGSVNESALAKLLISLLASLPGVVCIYQGEELGLPEAHVPDNLRQDPVGRDGCRTPMPWSSTAPHAGFTSGAPWLPVSPHHRSLAVNIQETEPHSTLNHTRNFLRWRRNQQALIWGRLKFLQSNGEVVAFIRTYRDSRVLAIFNVSTEDQHVRLPVKIKWKTLAGHGFNADRISNFRIILPPLAAFFAEAD